ncbi:hypothetical protein FHX16_001268 [Rhizobium sp. BK661]|nr:hypothetical protein [Rhizobium sp. BK661]
MWSGNRINKDATTRRIQPNWLLECCKAGIPYSALPTPPAPDASHSDKCKYTWALRKLWAQRTGRTIERLTPPGYAEKLNQKKQEARSLRESAGNDLIDQIQADDLRHEIRDLQREARQEVDAVVAEEIRQAEPFTQIDTRAGQDKSWRISSVSQTVKEGYRWVPDEDLSAEQVAARNASIIRAYTR